MTAAQKRFSNFPGATAPSPWGTLHRLLTFALGSQRQAADLISSALAASRLPVAPMSTPEVLGFVKTHLFATLTVAVGEYSAFSLTETFTAKLAETGGEAPQPDAPSASMPPTAPRPTPSMFRRKQPSISGEEGRPLALIALYDPLERSWLARALVGEGLDVRYNETIHELLEILRDPAILHVAVLDFERPDLVPVLRTITELRPTLPLIACTTSDASSAAVRLRATGLRLLHVHESSSPRRELVDCIVQHASGTP